MSYYTCGPTPSNPDFPQNHYIFPYSVFSAESPEKPAYNFAFKENAEDYCALMNFAHHTLRNQGGPSTSVGDKRLDKYCPPPILDGKINAEEIGMVGYDSSDATKWHTCSDGYTRPIEKCKCNKPELPRGGFF